MVEIVYPYRKKKMSLVHNDCVHALDLHLLAHDSLHAYT